MGVALCCRGYAVCHAPRIQDELRRLNNMKKRTKKQPKPKPLTTINVCVCISERVGLGLGREIVQ